LNRDESRFELKLDGKNFVRGGFKTGRPDGKWERFHPNGNKAVRAMYKSGLKTGTWRYYYPDGELKANVQFNRSSSVGNWTAYYPSGALQSSIRRPNQQTLVLSFYYPSESGQSKLALEEKRILSEDSTVYRQRHFSASRPYSFEKLVNGKRDSLWIRYHESGAVWEKLEFDRGLLIHVHSIQDEKHHRLDHGDFQEGNGLLKRYRPDGSLFSEIQFKQGEKNGRAWYYDHGHLTANGSYRHNKKIGTWKFFGEDSKPDYEVDFYDAMDQWAYVIFYGNSGFEREESEYFRGLRHGLSRTYNYLNKLELEQHYAYGLLHGEFSAMSKDGKLSSSGAYGYGMKVGEWRYYNNSGKVTFKEQFVRNPSVDTSSMIFYDMNEIDKIPFQSNQAWNSLMKPIDVQHLTFDMLVNENPNYEFVLELEYARFPGGPLAAQEYSQLLFRRARTDLNPEVKGELVLNLQMDEFGWVDRSTVELGLGFGVDELFLKTLKFAPIYIPAEMHGLPARGTYRHRINIPGGQ
jgi:antitoxin component YwqK of YwqJK toxin-antitoxin module